jgi:hypothetical protein
LKFDRLREDRVICGTVEEARADVGSGARSGFGLAADGFDVAFTYRRTPP